MQTIGKRRVYLCSVTLTADCLYALCAGIVLLLEDTETKGEHISFYIYLLSILFLPHFLGIRFPIFGIDSPKFWERLSQFLGMPVSNPRSHMGQIPDALALVSVMV